jgi:hypothetical protein
VSRAIFSRYSIPAVHRAHAPAHDIENDDMELDRADQL